MICLIMKQMELIFTPVDKGVGSDKIGEKAVNRKITWKFSLKWKPPELNTVDFSSNYE